MITKKQLAISKAKELDIDGVVRTVAKSGRCDEARINYWCEWEEGCTVKATFGAGTNSASVSLAGDHILMPNYLYKAGEYGRYIEVFKYGPWVHRLIEKAEEIHAVNQAKKVILRASAEAQEEAKFTEVDF